jgi:hypothetical protein
MNINRTATKAPRSPDDPVSGKFCSASDELAARRGVGEAVGVEVAEVWVVGVDWAVVVVVGRAGPDL